MIATLFRIPKKMAGEEDIELRDLVAHTLETRGVLGNIRVRLVNLLAHYIFVDVCGI